MAEVNDSGRCVTRCEPERTLIAVVEMSQSSWLVAAILPGLVALAGTSYCGRSQVIEIARTRVIGRRNCGHVNLDFGLRRVLVCARLCVHVHPGHPQPRLAARHPAARVLPGGRKGQETHPPQPDP